MRVAAFFHFLLSIGIGLGEAGSLFDGSETTPYGSAYITISYGDPLVTQRAEVGRFGDAFVREASGRLLRVGSPIAEESKKGRDGLRRVGGGEVVDTGCRLPLIPSPFSYFQRPLPQKQPLPASESWIALVRRGDCDFRTKAINAFHSNASGIIVFDDREGSLLDKMKLSPEEGRNISAVFTYHWKGEELIKLLENGTIIMVNISMATSSSRRYTTVNKTSVLFVSVSFVILMVISLAWLVFYYIQRFRYINAKDRLSKRLCTAAKKALSKIPTKQLKSDEKECQEGECCAICIESFKIAEVLRILPCKHEFHKLCIDPWLLEHRTCPMCKMDILKHYGFFFTGSQESILDLDTEETTSESDGLQQRNLSPTMPIFPSEIQIIEITHSEEGIISAEIITEGEFDTSVIRIDEEEGADQFIPQNQQIVLPSPTCETAQNVIET